MLNRQEEELEDEKSDKVNSYEQSQLMNPKQVSDWFAASTALASDERAPDEKWVGFLTQTAKWQNARNGMSYRPQVHTGIFTLK